MAGGPGRRKSALLIAALGAACAGAPPAEPEGAALRQAELEDRLARLADDATAEERRLLAAEVLRESRDLASRYRMTRPPILHNVLVNTGLRERGLCWHWTQDLLAHLSALPLPHYELHWGVAHRGELFREHNSVVVTARGAAFATGLVLDPWRRGGTLSFVPVAEDSYPWVLHEAPPVSR